MHWCECSGERGIACGGKEKLRGEAERRGGGAGVRRDETEVDGYFVGC